jgi:L-amino acid N-acyltransferase YncA
MNVRRIKDDDIEQITEIYNWYILNTVITFEMEAVSPSEMKKRVQEKVEKYDWLVGEVNQQIIGYAYYGAYHSRPAYSHTIEPTIYLAQEKIGKGFGKILYAELMRSAEERGFRELIGLIALPNQGSTTLHLKMGFKEIGVLKNVGYKFERYIDVGIWQKSMR